MSADDAVDALVGDLDQDHITRLALDLRRDLAVTRPGNEIAFLMTGHGAIFDRRRPFADRYRVLHLARPVSGWRAANGGSCVSLLYVREAPSSGHLTPGRTGFCIIGVRLDRALDQRR
jgi:hypothetical protein